MTIKVRPLPHPFKELPGLQRWNQTFTWGLLDFTCLTLGQVMPDEVLGEKKGTKNLSMGVRQQWYMPNATHTLSPPEWVCIEMGTGITLFCCFSVHFRGWSCPVKSHTPLPIYTPCNSYLYVNATEATCMWKPKMLTSFWRMPNTAMSAWDSVPFSYSFCLNVKKDLYKKT